MNEQIQTIEPEVVEIVSRKPVITTITKAEESETVTNYLDEIQKIRKRIEDFFGPDIEKAHQLHKSLIAKRNQVDAEPARLEMAYRRMLSDWMESERKRVQEEQRKLDEQARKDALKEAKKNGDEKTITGIQTGKIAVMSNQTPMTTYRPSGISSRESWKAEIVDANKIPRQYLMPDLAKINAVVRGTKGQINIA